MRRRISRKDGPRIRITKPNGSVIDITEGKVKEYKPVTDPRAPKGTLDQVKFPDDVPTLPGSKGKKRYPTEEELEVLKRETKK